MKKINRKNKTRIHILKVDVEGFDHKVVKSFIDDQYASYELPLLILFEAKVISPDDRKFITDLLAKRYRLN